MIKTAGKCLELTSLLYKHRLLLLGLMLLCWSSLETSSAQGIEQKVGGDFKLTLLYDNTTRTEGTKAGWGFACLIEGGEKTILFDTGADPTILLQNAATLRLDLGITEIVVISHNHGDHTKGLPSILERKKALRVLLPPTTPKAFMESVRNAGSQPELVTAPLKIDPRVLLIPTEGNGIAEISLVLLAAKRATVLTGCAHPGIVNILRRTKEAIGIDVTTLLGGFHLLNDPPERITEIIRSLKQMGVRRCAATHCTGEKAIAQFQESFGSDFIPVGVGSTLIP